MKSEIKTRYGDLIEHANKIRAQNIAEDRRDAALLAEDLKPLPCRHPQGDDGTGGTTWSEEESAKLLDLCRQAKEASERTEENPEGTDWAGPNENNKKYLAFKIVEAVQNKFFPPHRRRVIGGVGIFPSRMRKPFRDIFNLKDPATMPLDAPILKEQLNRLGTVAHQGVGKGGALRIWTPLDEQNLLTHLAQAMRKQWGPVIPEGDDRLGSIMFKDMIIAAQAETIPPERRRDLTNARQVLVNTGLLDRLQKILSGQEFTPPQQVKPSTTLAPAKENPVHHLAQPNGSAAPKTNATALADMLRSVAGYIETELGQAHKEAHEAHELCEAAIQENSELRLRLGNIEQQLSIMQKPSAEVTAPAPKKSLPRVAVLGCHLNEFAHIMTKAREAGLELEFKHYDQEQIPVQIKGDYALMLKWASPAWMQKMKESGIPADRRTIVQGGISRAVMQLQAWFAPIPAQAVAV